MKLRTILIIVAMFAVMLFVPLTVSALDEPDAVNGPDATKGSDLAGDSAEGGEPCEHNWLKTSKYEVVDEGHHGMIYRCTKCQETKVDDIEAHDPKKGATYYQKIDGTYHYIIDTCYYCKAEIKTKAEHDWDYWDSDEYYNQTYHGSLYKCDHCYAEKITNLEKHLWAFPECERAATLTRKGIMHYTCWDCDAHTTSYFPWRLYYSGCLNYDIVSHSIVYKTSKSITVKLRRPVKGSVLTVKIGKKTYKKTLGAQKSVKMKIKKSTYGKAITIKLYYKGKLIGTDACFDGIDTFDNVMFGKKIKKGMSKKKVKYLTAWGPPDDYASASGGWSYWYYDNGSYVVFKKGKVKRWYKR